MHKDQLSFVTVTPSTDFVITSSTDGVVKFWKKMAVGIEFVKEFRAHNGEIKSVSVSADGRSFATAGMDRTIKIFDVVTFGEKFDAVYLSLANIQGRPSSDVDIRFESSMCLLGPQKRRLLTTAGSIKGYRKRHHHLRRSRRESSPYRRNQIHPSNSPSCHGLQRNL
jgi:WD40 repeat protein